MEKAIQQTYYLQDEFVSIPFDEFPIRITRQEYYGAVDILEQEGKYIPSRENPNGENDYKERKFLLKGCLVELNSLSQLHQGKNTKTIRCFTELSDHTNLERLTETLKLPLLQKSLKDY